MATIEEFEEDLEALYETHPDVAGLIDALIEELGNDEDYLQTLLDDVPKWHFMYQPAFEFKLFSEARKSNRSIYSLKLYDLDGSKIPFRVFVTYDRAVNEYLVLSVQPRKTCYDTSTADYRDLCDRYDRLNIFAH
ncbi:hypothetical protein [Acidovorax sp. Root217]|uniref:hypothetical protein n=1 Tax=Acidovorax sp. Root217 TaxID=1736492 RepID=UPI0012FC355B|nr:hypothetical protein [Acidovorax sp. Root217]